MGEDVIEDAKLLEAWCNGDRSAGDELFERHYDAVNRFFCNKVGDATQCGDLVQETFKALVEGKRRIMDASKFRSYLFSVAYNQLKRYLREKHRISEKQLSLVTVHDLAPGPGPSTMLRESETHRLLMKALRRIPVEEQVLLELFYWERLSSREIGDIIGSKADAVRKRLQKARRLLDEALRKVSNIPELIEQTISNLDEYNRAAEEKEGIG